MPEPIVIGVALRDDDAAPLALGQELVGYTGASLALAHVFHDDSVVTESITSETATLESESLLAMVRLAEPMRGELEVRLHAEPDSSTVRGLRRAAERLDAALLVVGASHRGRIGRVVPGGLAERLLHAAPCAMAVAPRGYSGNALGIRRIGVAFNDTAEGHDALDAATAMAVLGGATLSIYTVTDPPATVPVAPTPGWVPPAGYDADRRTRARAAANRARASVPAEVLETVEVLDGDRARVLASASADVDLLLCGSRGFGALHGALVGAVSSALVHSCACPLIVLPRQRHSAARRLAATGPKSIRDDGDAQTRHG
jgi:nucleotide-binding universal stress UspA family protein